MIQTITPAPASRPPFGFSAFVFFLLLLGTFLYFYQPNEVPPPALASAKLSRTAAASNPTGLAMEYEVTASDIEVDWPGGGDFDPRSLPRSIAGTSARPIFSGTASCWSARS